MKKILNGLFLGIKWILFIASFSLTFYIVLSMYDRVNKSMIESIDLFIPYLLVLVIFSINIIARQKSVNQNIFYNLTCCIAFSVIVVVCIRAIYDKNMVLNEIMGYEINFSYFNDFLVFMKVLMYGMFLGNIFFMVHSNDKDAFPIEKEKRPLVQKIDTSNVENANIEVL